MLKRILATSLLLAGLALPPAVQQPVQAWIEICVEVTVCTTTPIGRVCGSVEACVLLGGG